MNIQLSPEDLTTIIDALDQYVEWAAEDEETAPLVDSALTLLDRLFLAQQNA
jgi:hypothetical protein